MISINTSVKESADLLKELASLLKDLLRVAVQNGSFEFKERKTLIQDLIDNKISIQTLVESVQLEIKQAKPNDPSIECFLKKAIGEWRNKNGYKKSSIERFIELCTSNFEKPIFDDKVNQISMHLIQIVNDPNQSNEDLYDKIESQFIEADRSSKEFINGLVTAICSSCWNSNQFNAGLFKRRFYVINLFISQNDVFQIEALLAIKRFITQTRLDNQIIVDILIEENLMDLTLISSIINFNSNELIDDRLSNIFNTKSVDSQVIINKIKVKFNQQERESLEFIKCLTCQVCQTVANQCVILKEFINHNQIFELEALKTIETLGLGAVKVDICQRLFNEDIIRESVFYSILNHVEFINLIENSHSKVKKEVDLEIKIKSSNELKTSFEKVLSCPICLELISEVLNKKIKLMATKCGHLFCEPCIDQYIKNIISTRNKKSKLVKCPTCRKIISKYTTREVFL